MYIYRPEPAAPPPVVTVEQRIAARRELLNHTQNIIPLRAALPGRVPPRVIGPDQVQPELNLWAEEELQGLQSERARTLNDPTLSDDSVVVARYLIRNNLMGELARRTENTAHNNAGTSAAPVDRSNLTIRQREALDTVIRTTRANISETGRVDHKLNKTSFNWTLDMVLRSWAWVRRSVTSIQVLMLSLLMCYPGFRRRVCN